MSKENIINKYQTKDYLTFILIIFCFVFIPAIILIYSVCRYYQINEEGRINALKTYNQHMISELRRNVSAEKYFCRKFHEYNLSELDKLDSNYKDSVDFCKKIKNEFGNRIDFVVLTNDGNIKYNSNPETYNYSQKIWYDAYHFVKYYYSPSSELLRKGERGNAKALNIIFGLHFIPRTLKALYLEKLYSFIWGDYSEKHLPGGVYTFKWGGFFVFISKDLLSDIAHLKNNILEYSSDNNIITGFFDVRNIGNSYWTNKDVDNYKELENILKDSESQNFIETNSYYICNQSLTDNYRLFTFTKKENTKLELFIKCIIIFFFYCILSRHIIKYFRNTVILKKPGEASIGLKIAFLFFFATAIPLILLAIVSYEYEIHKKETLIKEAKIWSTENILGVEQRYQSYLKTLSVKFDNYIDEWKNGLKDKNLTYDYMHLLGKKFAKYKVLDFYCVSTNTPYIASVEGMFKYNGSLDNLQFDLANAVYNYDQSKVEPKDLKGFVNRYKLSDFRLMVLIVKKLWSDLYGYEIPTNVLSKLEVIAESALQKKLSEIVYNFIEIEKEGIIKEWGYGNRVFGAYLKILSIIDNSLADYCIIVSWLPNDIQKMFVIDMVTKSNRNNKSFKLLAYERFDRFFVPENTNKNKELSEFAKRAGVKPTEELEIINYNGEDYIAVGVLGKKLDRYCFVGLYPMRNIDNELNKQKSLLWLLGVLTLILSVGLAQLLSKSFINPLLILQKGALAIENRNFNHRLSRLSSDEFGEVGDIFNHAMVGLQELEIAKVVQESMFPKPDFKQGNFTVFGKTVTMIDVGGDYLDFFKVDDNSFSVLVGDVAGHGVGAAVIMAMAKASVLNSVEFLRSPAAVLNQLHKIIMAAKNSKQRKIMTFQYLNVNSETGSCLYGNAGACSPWLIRHSDQSIQEVKVPGAALGAFKKSVYKEISLDLNPGDAVVFYTDGIVECKDKNGEMLGYERLKNMLLNCWDENPETYYNNIFNFYTDFVGEGAEAGDDLTFVILMYNR